MKINENFGYSDYTIYKQIHLGAIMRTHIKIVRSVISKASWTSPTYYYFDLNAGPGTYKYNGRQIHGSPLTFANCIVESGLPCKCVMFEIRDDLRNELIVNIERFVRQKNFSVAILEDHNRQLPTYFCQAGKQKRMGLVYSDPAGTLPPFELIGKLVGCRTYERLDVLIYMSATNLKRQLKAAHCNVGRRLREMLEFIPKRHWIVREPYGQHQWTFLIGTNWSAFPEFESIGFHKLESPRGREIFDIVNFTREELPHENESAGAAGPYEATVL